jgi:hypothetical protein
MAAQNRRRARAPFPLKVIPSPPQILTSNRPPQNAHIRAFATARFSPCRYAAGVLPEIPIPTRLHPRSQVVWACATALGSASWCVKNAFARVNAALEIKERN